MNMDKTNEAVNKDILQIKEAAEKFTANVSKVIVGKRDTIELLLAALLCEGHVLIEDVPGIGKTMLAKAISKSLDCSFSRIQCTPDLLPSDVTGIHYFNQRSGEFELRPGPVMANIVLADEVNRATPRTQSCLLESMQERQVTVDLETVPLPRPFMIIATQNPVELEGTFPLPEAQLDRFLVKVKLGYPALEEEDAILLRYQQDNPLDSLSSVLDAAELLKLQNICRTVHIEDSVRNYVVTIAAATRNHRSIELGASPRASLGLYLAAQSLAAIRGRDYVIPDDVKYLAGPVLSHRLVCKPEARLKGRSADALIEEILTEVPVPVED
jgi:MoxR-like ATPase